MSVLLSQCSPISFVHWCWYILDFIWFGNCFVVALIIYACISLEENLYLMLLKTTTVDCLPGVCILPGTWIVIQAIIHVFDIAFMSEELNILNKRLKIA